MWDDGNIVYCANKEEQSIIPYRIVCNCYDMVYVENCFTGASSFILKFFDKLIYYVGPHVNWFQTPEEAYDWLIK